MYIEYYKAYVKYYSYKMIYIFSARTSSIQTFDSLDFARYSDDGERQVDERVAGRCLTATGCNGNIL